MDRPHDNMENQTSVESRQLFQGLSQLPLELIETILVDVPLSQLIEIFRHRRFQELGASRRFWRARLHTKYGLTPHQITDLFLDDNFDYHDIPITPVTYLILYLQWVEGSSGRWHQWYNWTKHKALQNQELCDLTGVVRNRLLRYAENHATDPIQPYMVESTEYGYCHNKECGQLHIQSEFGDTLGRIFVASSYDEVVVKVHDYLQSQNPGWFGGGGLIGLFVAGVIDCLMSGHPPAYASFDEDLIDILVKGVIRDLPRDGLCKIIPYRGMT
jgi:hypothetical protein